MSNTGRSYHVELLRIRDDGSIEGRRFPPPFATVADAVAAAEDYVRGTEFRFRILDESGKPAMPEATAIRSRGERP